MSQIDTAVSQPSEEQIVQRARELIPLLRERAEACRAALAPESATPAAPAQRAA